MLPDVAVARPRRHAARRKIFIHLRSHCNEKNAEMLRIPKEAFFV
jgi:hypothetical protein